MEAVLISLVIGLFIAMLFVNIYFRVKVMRSYRVLVQNRVEFKTRDIFNQMRMEEIYAKHPKHQEEIKKFVQHIKYSVRMASVLIALITAFGAILMYYR